MNDEDYIQQFEEILKSISALLIEEVDKKVIKKFKGNILEVEFYLE